MQPAAAQDRARAQALGPGRVLVPLVALGVAAAQLLLRELDDSRLVSWRWVFAGVHPAVLFALLAAALAAAHLAAGAPLPVRRPGAVLLAAACAAALPFFGAPEAIVDASRYFVQAKYLEVYGPGAFVAGWGREISAWTDLPLVPALYGAAFRVLGESRAAAQALTTLLFAGTAVLTWRIGRALFDEEVGLAAGALLLAIPYLLTQVAVLLVDVPTMFFLALAVHAAIQAVQRGGAGRVVAAGIAATLALLAKYSVWPLLTAIPVVAAVHRGEAPGALRRAGGIALVAAVLGAAALFALRDAVVPQLALLLEYQAPGLRRWGESFVSLFLFQVHPFVSAAALLSAWVAFRRRDARWLVAAWPVLLLLALRIHRVRYWVPAFPSLALLAALGLQALRAADLRRAAVACAVASALVVALLGDLRFLRGTSAANLRAAGAYLDELHVPAAEVFTLRSEGAPANLDVAAPLLDLYASTRLVHEPGAPPASEVRAARESPLRFTWEYASPPWARGPAPEEAAVVVVASDLEAALPDPVRLRVAGRPPDRTFDADEGVFELRTLVRVWRPPPASSATPPASTGRPPGAPGRGP